MLFLRCMRTSSTFLLSSRELITIHYSKLLDSIYRPNFENPVHDWSHNMPCCIVRENLQQQDHCNTFIIGLTWRLSPRTATKSLKCSLPSLTTLKLLVIFILSGSKRTSSPDFGTYCLDCIMKCTFRQILFISAKTWSTLSRHAA